MAIDPETNPSSDDAELEREIRANRRFSVSEAIGRMAGGGMMKGASPVSRKQQAELMIENFLRRHLIDAGGALGGVLLRGVGKSDRLLSEPDQPLTVLADYLRQVLRSEYRLQDVVREADVEWGRMLGERPYFQEEGCEPHPNDPYTIESVRFALLSVLDRVTADER
jgi:hypothetical protein